MKIIYISDISILNILSENVKFLIIYSKTFSEYENKHLFEFS